MTTPPLLPGLQGPTRKAFKAGTHRHVGPEQTLARVRPFLGRMGITRVANVTGLARIGIPVVQAVRPNSRSLSVSQGKGLTLAAAKASALMEAGEAPGKGRAFQRVDGCGARPGHGGDAGGL
jgi:ribosomal protein S12 methylthiotransferase accessory factor